MSSVYYFLTLDHQTSIQVCTKPYPTAILNSKVMLNYD